MQNKIHINHVGFLPDARKSFVVSGCDKEEFVIQDMRVTDTEVLGTHEEWKVIYRGKIRKSESDFGSYMLGDFSDLTTPGMYRIKIPGTDIFSYQFLISGRAFDRIPYLLLDFIHNWRSGSHGLNWRDETNTDDGRRSDNGLQIDASGGWNDAGDLRKWMVHSNLPALGFLSVSSRLSLHRNYWHEEKYANNDFISEVIWSLQFINKMQDSDSGMFFEDIGGGGDARRTASSAWWYDNHAGVVADNSDNRFTDNIPASGDERSIRVQYNPIAQYTSISILLRSYEHVKEFQPELAEQSGKSALKCWEYMEKNTSDAFHKWTSVLAWRLIAAIELWKLGYIEKQELMIIADTLISNYSMEYGFWWMDADKNDFYRGVLHSAQPLIALSILFQQSIDKKLNDEIKSILKNTWETYALPLSRTNPFGFIPYGTYLKPGNEVDHFRKFRSVYYRNFMPDNAPQHVNHGLSGHWTSWAHALALMSKILDIPEIADSAFDQLFWLLGGNTFNSSLVTGLGYNQPMPHSRHLGEFPGGFMVGFIGYRDDKPHLDLEGHAQWNTCEYWNTPNANCMLALSELLAK